MHGARLIFRHRENRPADHLAQHVLRQGNGLLGIDLREVGIIVGIHGRDLEGGSAAANGNVQLVVHADADLLVRQLAHDVKEQPRGHDAGAGLQHLRADAHGDSRFQIEARQLK